MTTAVWFWLEHTEKRTEARSSTAAKKKKKKKSNITTTESATALNMKDLEALYQEFYRAVSYLLTFGSQDTHWAKVLGLPSQLKMATRTKNPSHHKMVDAGHAHY